MNLNMLRSSEVWSELHRCKSNQINLNRFHPPVAISLNYTAAINELKQVMPFVVILVNYTTAYLTMTNIFHSSN